MGANLDVKALNQDLFVMLDNTTQGIVRKSYKIDHKDVDQKIQDAAKQILELIQDNQHLRCTFEIKNVGQLISTMRFLFIFQSALSLATERADIRIPHGCCDVFTENWVDEPVSCSKNHVLELSRATFWLQNNGNTDVCPAGNHPIGSLSVDDMKRDEVRKEKKRLDHQDVVENRLLAIQTQNSILSNTKTEVSVHIHELTGPIVTLGSSPIKVAIKFGIEEAAKKSFSKDIVKRMPVASIVIGVALCLFRINHGYKTGNGNEYRNAFLELLSGGLACIPGIGTIASVGIDLTLAFVDSHLIYSLHNDANATKRISIDDPYAALGLSQEDCLLLTKAEVDRAYKSMQSMFHSDNDQDCIEDITQTEDKYFPLLKEALDKIYKERGWT